MLLWCTIACSLNNLILAFIMSAGNDCCDKIHINHDIDGASSSTTPSPLTNDIIVEELS